jgi:ATP-dependent Clp protease ATP-binding subunit ClpA
MKSVLEVRPGGTDDGQAVHFRRKLLDPEMRSTEVLDFERRLLSKMVGQDRAVRRIVNMYQIYLQVCPMPGRPIGNLLFLGPQVRKDTSCRSFRRNLFGIRVLSSRWTVRKFQHSHEIAKLIGSPPGYLGHRERLPAYAGSD